MIQGAYRTIRSVAPLLIDTQQMEDAIIMQLHTLQNQLQRLGPYTMYTDGGWEYGGDGMDAPFYPYTDSLSHKGGGSIIFITTDLERIRSNFHGSEDQTTKTIDHVAIRIEHGEEVARGPNKPPRATGFIRRTGSQHEIADQAPHGQAYWIGLQVISGLRQ